MLPICMHFNLPAMYAHTSKPFSLTSHASCVDVSNPPLYARTSFGLLGSGS